MNFKNYEANSTLSVHLTDVQTFYTEANWDKFRADTLT